MRYLATSSSVLYQRKKSYQSPMSMFYKGERQNLPSLLKKLDKVIGLQSPRDIILAFSEV